LTKSLKNIYEENNHLGICAHSRFDPKAGNQNKQMKIQFRGNCITVFIF